MYYDWKFWPAEDEPLPAAAADWQFDAALPQPWALTSPGALGRGPDGRWTAYPANTPRPYHDPVTRELRGILIEPARSQLIYKSRPFAPTSTFQAAIVADTTTQTPLGIGGVLLRADTTTATHGCNLFFGTAAAAAVADNTVVALQLVFKPVGFLTRGAISLQLRNASYKGVEFSTANGGTIISSTALWARISPDTDGFFRLELAVNFGAGTTNPSANIALRLDDGTKSFAGDGTAGFLIAYYGAEIGAETTSPIINAGTAAATVREADVLTSGSEWIEPGEMSLGIQFTPLGQEQQTILHLNGADMLEIRNSPAQIGYTVNSENVGAANLNGPAAPAGTERTVIVTAAYNLFWLVQDGKKLAFDESGAPPSRISAARIGALVTGAYAGPMILRRIKAWTVGLDREAAAAFSRDLSIPGVSPILPVIDIQASRTVDPSVTALALTVTLTGEATGANLSYRTIDGTAKAGTDYTAAAGNLVFQPGENTAEIAIALGTRSLEQTRAFQVEIYAPTGAVLGTALCTVTLTKAAPSAHAPVKSATFNGPLTADWTVARNTVGMARNAQGVWTAVQPDQPRIHYTAPGECGLLIEPVGEQCLLDSVEKFYTSGSTITVNRTNASPTGPRTLIWRENSALSGHQLRAAFNATVADWPAGEFTLFMILRPVGTRTLFRFSTKGIDNVWQQVRVELSGQGSVVAVPAGVLASVTPEPFWPGWYRVSVTRTQGASAGVNAEMDIGPIAAPNTLTLQGDPANGIDLCHIQAHAGAEWQSPIPAEAATAKSFRAADVLKAAGGWQRRNSFALGARFMRLSDVQTSQRIVQFRDADPAVDDYGLLTNAGALRSPLTTNGKFNGNIDGAAIPVGQYVTALMSIDTLRHAVFLNGAKSGERAMTGLAMPRLVEHIRFGSKEQDGAQGAPIMLQAVGYWNVGVSDDEGAVFSANLSGTPPGEIEPEPIPTVQIPAALSVIEGTTLDVPITKVGNGACSVSFTTKSQTATYNKDYRGVGPLLVEFAENESTKLVPVQTLADTEADAGEKFGIEISAPVGCVLGNAIGVVTIDEVATVSVPVTASVEEGQTLALTVSKSGGGACSVTVRTADPVSTTVEHTNKVVQEVLDIFKDFKPTKTIYVSTTGLDTNAGTSAAPYKTITKAVANAAAGTLIKIKSGTYANEDGLSMPLKGTAAAPIVVECDGPQHSAIINGKEGAAALECFGFKYLMIRNLHFVAAHTSTTSGDYGGCKMHGSVTTPSSHLYFVGNKISGVGRDAFKLFAGSKKCLIVGNTIEGSWGEPGECVDNVQVEDVVYAYNTIGGTTAGSNSMTFKAGSRNCEIVGNLFNSTGGGLRLGGAGNSRCDRDFPDKWKGEDIVAGGFEGYRLYAHDNVITTSGGTSISFIGAVECTASNNYLSKPVNIDSYIVKCDGVVTASHYSSKSTVKDNVFAAGISTTPSVVAGNTSGNAFTGNTNGNTKPSAGADAALVAAYIATTTAANAAMPTTDYTPIAPTVVSFTETETSKTVQVVTKTDAIADDNEVFDVVISDPEGCSLANASTRVTITAQGAEPTPVESPGTWVRANGFASAATCGENKLYYRVTNLNDSGAGSFRDGATAGDCHIIFEVGGTCRLSSNIDMTKPNVTISGETAPWPGFILQNKELNVKASNIRIKHLTVEKGYDGSDYGIDNGDCMKLSPGSTSSTWTRSNIHVSHCSFFWSQDEMVEIWPSGGNLSNVSFHDCILGEALYKPQSLGYRAHKKVSGEPYQSQHNYGLIIGYGTKRMDVQNTYFHDMDMRFPFCDHSTSLVLANNITLNTTKGATVQHNKTPAPAEKMLITCKGYLSISGPNSTAHSPFRFHSHAQPMYPGTRAYVTGLAGWKGTGASITPTDSDVYRYSTAGKPYCTEGGQKVWVEVSSPPIDTPTATKALSADDIYKRALENVGPLPKLRNNHNLRSVNKLKNKSGKWVNHESEAAVGGKTPYVLRTRKLDGTTKFDDGVTIPAPPTSSNTTEVRAWLEKFLSRVQYD